jgi:hypothetical protein
VFLYFLGAKEFIPVGLSTVNRMNAEVELYHLEKKTTRKSYH